MTATSSANKATVAASDLVNALQNTAPKALFAQLGDEKTTELKAFSEIFKQATPMTAPAEPAAPDPVGPAQRVPRVNTTGNARYHPLPRVLQSNNTPEAEVPRVEPPQRPEHWHDTTYARETDQGAKNRPITRLQRREDGPKTRYQVINGFQHIVLNARIDRENKIRKCSDANQDAVCQLCHRSRDMNCYGIL